MKTCKIENCIRPTKCRGLCANHYANCIYHGTLDLVSPPVATHCSGCGEALPPDRDFRKTFCSSKCKDKVQGQRRTERLERIVTECLKCGKSLLDRGKKAKFCSRECLDKHHNHSRSAEIAASKPACLNCNTQVGIDRTHYCSTQCKQEFRRARQYGLDRSGFDLLLTADACAICTTSDWGPKGQHIDHDHATGKVRGVLCQRCNCGLGMAKDQIPVLQAAVAYLQTHSQPA